MALPSARGWEDLETSAPALAVAVGISQAILAVSLKAAPPPRSLNVVFQDRFSLLALLFIIGLCTSSIWEQRTEHMLL